MLLLLIWKKFQTLSIEKARALAIELGYSDDEGLNLDWIQRFKKKHNISTRRQLGESGKATINWRESTSKTIQSQYSNEDIFNLDETGLFWEALPERTMAFRGHRCSGGKKSKNRITVLVGANSTGTESSNFCNGKIRKPKMLQKQETNSCGVLRQ